MVTCTPCQVCTLPRRCGERKLGTMKTVTVREAQTNFPELLRVVEAGEEIKVVRRKKAVANIVPINGKAKQVDWSGHFAKLDSIFGGKPAPGKPGSRIVIDGRR